ncbi:chemotaxis protein CheB [Pseudomonadota bacterium]
MTTKKSTTKKKTAPRKKAAKKKSTVKAANKRSNTETTKQKRSQKENTHSSFPVVGVGASAGGLNAFRELLQHLPVDTGMAFVLVQHLDPHHESLLPSLLSGVTTMPVCEAQDNMQIAPNHIYVIPPNTNIGILHNTLQLVQRQTEGWRYLPVDWFLRTLAEDRGSGAIGVILSGTASDGTQGLEAVKAAGGIAFAQEETSAEHFGMPRSAIAAGCVDFVLSPREIAREIGRVSRSTHVMNGRTMEESLIESGDQLNKIFLLLRTRTGHDFTYYKHTTIKRRIKRRMLVHKLERLGDYVRLLEREPREVDALFQDILINVTSFFRDPEAFEALQTLVFPKLLDKRPSELPLRLWVPGCATGEEAYTLAIILSEYLRDRASNISVQIFATDIDDQAIGKARQGIYPERVVDEVSPERLKRFFVKVAGGYQVNKTIRDMCIFAEQDITKDPPFSRMDLICCRNLMIYLGAVLQKKVLQIFHYALQPSGFLMLGTSETIGGHAELFRLVDQKGKLYAKKTMAARINYQFATRTFIPEEQPVVPQHQGEQLLFYNLHQEAEQVVLAKYGPPGAVINRDMEVLHFRGETGPYLNPSPGSASLNLLKLVRQELAAELRAAVYKASKEGKQVRKEGVRLGHDGNDRRVDLQIIPLKGPVAEECCMLVLFEDVKQSPDETGGGEVTKVTETDQLRLREMEQELATSREYMQSIIEAQETSNEELKSANEEIQSTNEELQSTNEELETAKEELQSTNEELATVNEELENRNLELSAANNDMTNLLASVNLPILMLGEDLRVRQFTPQAEKLLNLIGSDIGRPISQIRANVEIPDLEAMVSKVIDTMAIESLEVQDSNGHWYNVRARPYKTMDNRIEGAVITFIDIDDIKDAERLRKIQVELLEIEERLQAIINNSATAIFAKDPEGRYLLVNKRVEMLLGLDSERIVGKTDHELLPKTYADLWNSNDKEVIRSGEAMEFEEVVSFDGCEHTFLTVKFPLKTTDGKVYAVGGVATDITERHRVEQAQRRLAAVVRDSNDAITVLGFDGTIQAWNPAAVRLYGWSELEALAMNIHDIVPEIERPIVRGLIEQVRKGEVQAPLEATRLTKAGKSVRVLLTASLLVDENGQPKAVATTEKCIEFTAYPG